MADVKTNEKTKIGIKAYDLIFWAIFIAMSLGGFTMIMFAAFANK